MIRFILLLALVAYSCSQSTLSSQTPSITPNSEHSKDSLYIHLTGGFKSDSLVIKYADVLISESNITTGDLGFAREIVIPDKGTDRIQVHLIRPGKSYSTEIKNTGKNFIEVWYCKDDILKHYSRNKPFVYK